MMSQCKFINCNEYNTLVGDVDNRERYVDVETGAYRKSLWLPPPILL